MMDEWQFPQSKTAMMSDYMHGCHFWGDRIGNKKYLDKGILDFLKVEIMMIEAKQITISYDINISDAIRNSKLKFKL
jgi:hypothetical protein